MSKIPVIALSLFLLAAACKNDTAPAAAPAPGAEAPEATAPIQPTARKQIVFFGNSLTAAYNLSPEQGFPALIQQKIDALGLPYTCVNAGLSGETTADGKSRIDWVLQQPIDVFVLELGANDALRGLPVQQSRQNLEAILQKVRAKYPEAKIVIAGMLAPPNLGASYTGAFRQMFVDLSRSYDAAFVPFLLEGVAGDPGLNLEDGIHPNVEGQKIVAETVWKVLQPLLR